MQTSLIINVYKCHIFNIPFLRFYGTTLNQSKKRLNLVYIVCIKLERHTRTIKYVSRLVLEYTFTYVILQLESSKNYKVMLRFIQIPKFWNITSVTVYNSEVDTLKLVSTWGFACFSWCLGLDSRPQEKHWLTTVPCNWPKTSAVERNWAPHSCPLD